MIVNTLMTIITFLLFQQAILQNKNAEISAKAAVDAVKSVEKQFEIENTPYLIVKELSSLELSPNRPISTILSVANISNSPVKLTSIKSVSYFTFSSNYLDNEAKIIEGINAIDESPIGGFVSSSFPYQVITKTNTILNEYDVAALEKKLTTLYLAIELTYVNLTNEKKRKFLLCIKVTSIQPLLAEIGKIDNWSIE